MKNLTNHPTHAPTPWKQGVNHPERIIATDVIAYTNVHDDPPTELEKANAAFIVRAVNAYQPMIEALRGALYVAEAWLEEVTEKSCGDAMDTAEVGAAKQHVKMLSQAIAKAEGR